MIVLVVTESLIIGFKIYSNLIVHNAFSDKQSIAYMLKPKSHLPLIVRIRCIATVQEKKNEQMYSMVNL